MCRAAGLRRGERWTRRQERDSERPVTDLDSNGQEEEGNHPPHKEQGHRYFIHFLNDTPPHMASAARISPPVGAMTLVKASPIWKARTAV